MATKVIAVAREFGSLGRIIAKSVAQKMGVSYYDRDIIDAAAVKLDIPISKYLELSDMQLSAYDRMIYPLGIGNAVKKDRIYEAEKEIILRLAKEENCVMVGRCSDYILHDVEGVDLYSVFIYAPFEERINFCIRELGITPEKVDDYILRVDRGRSTYYKRHTGEDFHSIRYRHLMIDSSSMPREETVELICNAASRHFVCCV